MEEGSHGLEELIYGLSTASPKSQYNYTLHYFRQQRKYKRVTVIFLFFLFLGSIHSCYQIIDSLLSLSTFNLTMLLLFLDGIMFLIVCYKSISHLTWPHQTPIFYYLLLNLIISITRSIVTQAKITIIRSVYICVLTVVISYPIQPFYLNLIKTIHNQDSQSDN